ncbi:MAG: amidase [Candidatus Saccharimonas sp.]|nr:amidase [Planctomycetaceae bacterium]
MDIVFSDATHLAEAIRTGDISASEALEAHLAQIEKHNAALNAVVTLDAEAARKRALEADAAVSRGELWGPLHGVPFTLKDAHATAGMRTTTGAPPLDHVPKADGTVATRLKSAGGVLMGKTNVHMLLADALQTENPIFGRTNNPWDVTRTPGGSSGGPAAALASGMTPFEVGSDLAGSIRIPADFCGLFGLKPTERRVSLDGFFPDPHSTVRSVRIMSCIGPMARSVEDLELIYSLIAGPDGCDTEVQPVPVETPFELNLKGLRLAFAPTFGGLPVAADIGAALEELVRALQGGGATVEEAALSFMDFDKMGAGIGKLIGMVVGAFQPEAGAAPMPLTSYLEALNERDEAIRALEGFFEGWDALLCPVSMTSAFLHCKPGTPLRIDEQQVGYELGNAHCVVFNYTGHPAVVLPYKRDRDGLPVGVQLVGRRWSESRLLALAKAMTRITGGFQRPPGY